LIWSVRASIHSTIRTYPSSKEVGTVDSRVIFHSFSRRDRCTWIAVGSRLGLLSPHVKATQASCTRSKIPPYGRPNAIRGKARAAIFDLGRVDEAIEAQQGHLNLERRMRNEINVAWALCALGSFYLDRDPVVSADYFRRALASLETPKSRTHQVGRLLRSGFISSFWHPYAARCRLRSNTW
jgi:hypothetical protein